MRVFVIAGEASGDRLGGALMAGLKALAPDKVRFQGIGGAAMQAEGLVSLFDMSELSLMGIAEILPKYLHLKRRIRETAQAVLAARPDVLVTIDSPDFCLRVARLVKARADIPVVHYVAPSVWAWRPGRAAKMARWVDHVLTLLPFEPPYMQAAGMGATFVGHPVVAEPVTDGAEATQFRAAYGLGGAPLVLALPGSRRGEVKRLAPVFAASLRAVLAARPDLRVAVVVAPGLDELVKTATADWPGAPVLIPAREAAAKGAAFAAADVALAASGTVSLELAAAKTPMLIAYDMSWLSRQIISRALKIDSVTLVNLVSQTRAVPEFIGADCRAELIAPALADLLEQGQGGEQREAMRLTLERLGQGGENPGHRAARAVLGVIARAGQGRPTGDARS